MSSNVNAYACHLRAKDIDHLFDNNYDACANAMLTCCVCCLAHEHIALDDLAVEMNTFV